MAVTKALNEVDGIKDIKVDLSKGEATFEEERPTDINVFKAKIKKAGYEVVYLKEKIKKAGYEVV
jgi:copper chaperone CopZ